jgi:hypothetical protein
MVGELRQAAPLSFSWGRKKTAQDKIAHSSIPRIARGSRTSTLPLERQLGFHFSIKFPDEVSLGKENKRLSGSFLACGRFHPVDRGELLRYSTTVKPRTPICPAVSE